MKISPYERVTGRELCGSLFDRGFVKRLSFLNDYSVHNISGTFLRESVDARGRTVIRLLEDAPFLPLEHSLTLSPGMEGAFNTLGLSSGSRVLATAMNIRAAPPFNRGSKAKLKGEALSLNPLGRGLSAHIGAAHCIYQRASAWSRVVAFSKEKDAGKASPGGGLARSSAEPAKRASPGEKECGG
ncbi:MAG: hypothetical protein LBR53_12565 [Deltaproteobacteria bacterium]|nr:hypothetical protein [Deltaproteobacteria bacterium]